VAQPDHHELARSVGPFADEVSQARPQLKSGDVLTIAASWERWVNRETSAEEAIDHAF
jgi:hypothetical protein